MDDGQRISKNLEIFISRKEAGLVSIADIFGKSKMTQYAKVNRRWTDQTNRARNGLHGGGFLSGKSIISFIAHGVDYGKYLEKSNFGAYAILKETTLSQGQEYKRLIERFINS